MERKGKEGKGRERKEMNGKRSRLEIRDCERLFRPSSIQVCRSCLGNGNRRVSRIAHQESVQGQSSSEELGQRLEKRFHCTCHFHALLNFSDFQLSEKYSRKFARFFVRMLALLALR